MELIDIWDTDLVCHMFVWPIRFPLGATFKNWFFRDALDESLCAELRGLSE